MLFRGCKKRNRDEFESISERIWQRDMGSRKRENDNVNREFEGKDFENEGDGGFLFNW